MTQEPRRIFTDEQKAEAVRIVNQSGKPVSQVAKEMGLTETALRNGLPGATVLNSAGQSPTLLSLTPCMKGYLHTTSQQFGACHAHIA